MNLRGVSIRPAPTMSKIQPLRNRHHHGFRCNPSVSCIGAVVVVVARHPLAPHLMGPSAVEQSCCFLSFRLGVVHRFDGLSPSVRRRRLLSHRNQGAAVVRTSFVMSDDRSRHSQQTQKQANRRRETHLNFDHYRLILMHKGPFKAFDPSQIKNDGDWCGDTPQAPTLSNT